MGGSLSQSCMKDKRVDSVLSVLSCSTVGSFANFLSNNVASYLMNDLLLGMFTHNLTWIG